MTNPRCSALNRHGEPCKAKPVKDGKCAVHAGLSDPRAMGRAGGLKKPETELRKAVKEDDALREQAREVIKRAMAGEDVSKAQLDAARSLFAYRAASPPEERREYGESGVHFSDGRRVHSLLDLLELALFGGADGRGLADHGPGDGDPLRNPEWQALVDRAAARVAEIRAEANGAAA